MKKPRRRFSGVTINFEGYCTEGLEKVNSRCEALLQKLEAGYLKFLRKNSILRILFKLCSDLTPLKVFKRCSIWPLRFSKRLLVRGTFSLKERHIMASGKMFQNHFRTYFSFGLCQKIWSFLKLWTRPGIASIWFVLKIPFMREYMTWYCEGIGSVNLLFPVNNFRNVLSRWKMQSWWGIFSSASSGVMLEWSSLTTQIGLYPRSSSRLRMYPYAVLFSVSSTQKSTTPISVSYAICTQTDSPKILTYFPSSRSIFDDFRMFFRRFSSGSIIWSAYFWACLHLVEKCIEVFFWILRSVLLSKIHCSALFLSFLVLFKAILHCFPHSLHFLLRPPFFLLPHYHNLYKFAWAWIKRLINGIILTLF